MTYCDKCGNHMDLPDVIDEGKNEVILVCDFCGNENYIPREQAIDEDWI